MQRGSSHRVVLLLPVLVAGLIFALAGWIGIRLIRAHADLPGHDRAVLSPAKTQQPVGTAATAATAEPKQSPSTQDESAGPAAQVSPENRSAGVREEKIPLVPAAARPKIRGQINVNIRVLVDASGIVVGQYLETRGPSRYLARLAGDAASEWKFVPTDAPGPRVWLLKFAFDRDGCAVSASPR